MSTTQTTSSGSTGGGNQGGNKRGIYIALILLLIILNAFFIYSNLTTKKEKDELEAAKIELDSEYAKVKGDLDQTIKEYEALMGENAELDSVLTIKIAELEDNKAQLEKALKEKNWSVSQYNKVKKELDKLKKEKEQFVATIDSLQKLSQYLAEVNDSLNTNLTSTLGENVKLKTEKKMLSEKVEIGSLLKPENVEITGVRYKGNGSERETNSAKKSEKLRFCFNVPENKVSDPGEKTILVRVLGPNGSTLAVSSQGSGVFVAVENGEQMQYTTKATFDYSNKVKPVCIYWSQPQAYASGTYKVHFYQNGYLLGSYEYDLK